MILAFEVIKQPLIQLYTRYLLYYVSILSLLCVLNYSIYKISTHFDLTKTMVLCNTSAQHELVVIWNVYACIVVFQNKYLEHILPSQPDTISDNEFLSDANFSMEWVARLYFLPCHVQFSCCLSKTPKGH